MTSPPYYYIPYEGTFSPLFLQKQTEEGCLFKAGAGRHRRVVRLVSSIISRTIQHNRTLSCTALVTNCCAVCSLYLAGRSGVFAVVNSSGKRTMTVDVSKEPTVSIFRIDSILNTGKNRVHASQQKEQFSQPQSYIPTKLHGVTFLKFLILRSWYSEV